MFAAGGGAVLQGGEGPVVLGRPSQAQCSATEGPRVGHGEHCSCDLGVQEAR